MSSFTASARRVEFEVVKGVASAGYGPGSGPLRPSPLSRPLHARVLVLQHTKDDGAAPTRVVFVALELHCGTRPIEDGILAALGAAPHGLRREELVVSGTHTHTGPNGLYGARLFNQFAGGEGVLGRAQPEQIRAILHAVVPAVRDALGTLEPVRIHWVEGRALGIGTQRSPEAFESRPDAWCAEGRPGELTAGEPPGRRETDARLPVLVATRKEARVGEPAVLATLAVLACHNTALGPQSFAHPDFFGLASWNLEQGSWDPQRGPVAGVALALAGAAGDVSPLDPEALRESGQGGGCACQERLQLAEKRGKQLAAAWRHALLDERRLEATRLTTRIGTFAARKLVRQGDLTPPTLGIPMLGGAEDFRSSFYRADGKVREGRRQDAETEEGAKEKHRAGWPKIALGGPGLPEFLRMLGTRLHDEHYLRVVEIGDRAILALPGEPTLEFGDRLCTVVRQNLDGVRRAICVGYSSDYIGYLTTPAAYERQQYEGGATLYGRHTLREMALVVDAMTKHHDAPPPPAPLLDPFDEVDGTYESA